MSGCATPLSILQLLLLSKTTGITNDGEKEEFVNEANLLEELDLFIPNIPSFIPMLKLTERQGNQDEKLLNAEISNLIGRRLHDFDVMGAEVLFQIQQIGSGWYLVMTLTIAELTYDLS